jgi:hypothetical protein
MLTIREESRQKFKVIFENEARERFIPISARYRLDDKTNGYTTELIGWTDMTPDEAVDVTIPSSANRILNDSNRYETRILTVQSDYGTDNQLSEDETYRVMNLSGFQ